MIERYYAHKKIKYYEIANNLQPLVLIHAQGVDGKSYANVAKRLSKKFHVYSLDCYGHGGSGHATVAPTEYDNDRALPTLPINIGGYSVYFIPQGEVKQINQNLMVRYND